MSRMVHARLDLGTEKMLSNLCRCIGCGDSEIIRRGIRVLASLTLEGGGKRIAGLGKFKSGLPDLGSNKTRLKGFGRS